MKKKVLMLFIASFMLVNVVSAAGIWGTYKGNNIINLTVSGSPIRITDVPAINYNGRTMIPIYLLQQAGVNYTWDQENQSVDITKATPPTNGNSSDATVANLKFYSRVIFEYDRLELLGGMIKDLADGYSTAYNGIGLGRADVLTTMFQRLNQIIDNYNKERSTVDDLTKELWSKNIQDGELVAIMNKFNTALGFFKATDTYINKYNISRSSSDFDNYLKNSSDGFDAAYEGLEIASNKAYSYFLLTQE